MERVCIYIDGCNFYYGLKTINRKYNDFHFDFEKYRDKLAGKNRQHILTRYYNAPLKQQINPSLYSDQQRFFDRLRKIPNFKVRLCKRQMQVGALGEAHFKVKEDDIYLALDMLKDAYANRYDTAILVSSDGDFVPAVKYVKELNKKVETIYFPKMSSIELLKHPTLCIPIEKKTIKKLYYKLYRT